MNKLTFAVLAYKDSPYLSECLESLKNQTIESNIHISTSTPSPYISDIAKKYGVELFVNEVRQGGAADCNFSLRHVKTKYVTLTHQDDIYLPEYAEACLAAAEKFKNTLICFTNYSEIVDGKERPVNLSLRIKRFMLWVFMPFKNNIRSKFWKTKLLSMGNPISAPTVMFNLEKLPGFQYPLEFNNIPQSLDWLTWHNMAKMEGRFVYVKKILLKRRLHPDTLTKRGLENNSRQIEDLEMFKKFWPGFIAKIIAKLYSKAYK